LIMAAEMPRGGHFAAHEEPDLLAEDIRMFFRPLREETPTNHHTGCVAATRCEL